MLMHSHVSADRQGHRLSECTITDIKRSLLYRSTGLLNLRYECLLKENPSKVENLEPYRKLAEDSLPGQFYSLTDQCELATLNRDSYSDVNNELLGRCRIKCVQGSSTKNIEAMDGTPCGSTSGTCFQGECQEHTDRVIGARMESQELCPNGLTLEWKSLLREHKCQRDYCHYKSQKNFCCQFCLKFERDGNCDTFEANPCFNGGICVMNGSSYYCKCQIGYQGYFFLKYLKLYSLKKIYFFDFKGELCLGFNPCELDPCQENEVCQTFGSLGNYRCLCTPDHTEYPFCRTSMTYDYLAGLRVSVKKRPLYRWFLNLALLGTFFVYLVTCLYKFRMSKKTG